MIRLGCCSFVLGKPFEDSLRLVHDLGFRYVDVSASRIGADAHIDQAQAVLDPERWAATTRDLLARYELEPEELFNTRMFVDGERVETNDPDPARRAQALQRFERLCAYAVQAGFKSIMAVPGMPQAALGAQESWDVAAQMLQTMLATAHALGIRFNVEPHTGLDPRDPCCGAGNGACYPRPDLHAGLFALRIARHCPKRSGAAAGLRRPHARPPGQKGANLRHPR